MYVLRNTNKKSKYFGQLCVSPNKYCGSVYVRYADNKSIYTNVNNFAIVHEIRKGEIVKVGDRTWKINDFGYDTIYLTDGRPFSFKSITTWFYLKNCFRFGAKLE